MIEFDVESTGFQPWSRKQRAFLYCFYDPEVGEAEALWPGVDDARIEWWFQRGAEKGIRAWNSKFDRAFGDTDGYLVPDDGVWHDGMVAAQVINERRSIALKAVGEELFGEDARSKQKEVKGWLTQERARRKSEAKENGTELIEPDYSDVPRDLIIPYGLEDVYLTRKIMEEYEPLLEQSPELQGVYDFEMKVLDALYAVEARGLPADEQAYRKLEVEVIKNLDVLEDNLTRLAKVKEFNPKSSAEVIAALERRGADMKYMETTEGKVKKADKENLGAVDDELAREILRFRSEFKVLSTYVRPMLGRHYDSSNRMWYESFITDGRIHASYRQVGARTGRMSCANPNMQNQPRDDLRLRYNIRAEEGKKLVTCDLSNIEMRLFAAYAGEGKMLDAIRNGEDMHEQTAKFIGIHDRRRAGGEIETARQRGKTFNFSIVYGGGIRTIRKSQMVDQAQARAMRKRYFDAYPEIVNLQNRIQYRLEDQGYVKDLWGRRYRAWSPNESYKFVNYLVQGSASEILKEALIGLHYDKVPVCALVHDEVVAHVDEKDAPEVQNLIEKWLCNASAPGGKLYNEAKKEAIVPLEADGVIVDHWSQAKDPNWKPKWTGG
jgi:DNA polymerase I-like protein with 3'-5' exonuclease and polymerase domains